jgi:fatty acid desaturase
MKYISYILLVAVVLFAGYCVVSIVSFFGIGKFYVPLIIVSVILSLVFAFLHLFNFITLTDNDKPNVLKFLDWIVSEQGQYLVEKTGYCPMRKTDLF